MLIQGDITPNNKSIAVLPFINLSTDADNEYFSDGITEEIINALTTIKGLKVIARTSSFVFKNKNVDVREIGNQLGVKTVLEGSVRKANKKVRITAQLIDVEDGSHIWSKNFDRELQDIFELQDEISLLIADQLRENFGHFELEEHLVEAPTNNIEAYNFYLKGRHHHLKWNANDLLLGVEFYKESIQLDPDFALP
ncbi:MAG: adenylate cyclase, partial [Salibacteraceae bacterium]